MTDSSVEKIAEVVLYEGYLLYPYTRSAMKNQQRWTFGGVYPRQYSEQTGDDPWIMQTQCLIAGNAETVVEIKVRFLQIVDRRVMERIEGTSTSESRPELRAVDELRVAGAVHRPWEEALEREVITGDGGRGLRLGDLVDRAHSMPVAIDGGCSEEPVIDGAGTAVGAIVREWCSLRGSLEIGAAAAAGEPGGSDAGYLLTVRILNDTPMNAPAQGTAIPRAAALRRTCISTHTILRVQGGEFVSLLEPPVQWEDAARRCDNIGTWPVLVGEPGERHTLLSSPIILYDYPQISPESPGDLFETTEIDELLTLSIMTLTDEEKQEMRESDPRGREILERTETLSQEALLKLHGAIRGLQPSRGVEE